MGKVSLFICRGGIYASLRTVTCSLLIFYTEGGMNPSPTEEKREPEWLPAPGGECGCSYKLEFVRVVK